MPPAPQSTSWRFLNLLDGDGSIARPYGVAGPPTTFVIDWRGRIVATLRGPQARASFEQAVRSAG